MYVGTYTPTTRDSQMKTLKVR